MISDRTANILIAVVTGMWVVNIGAGMFEVNGWQPSESVNGAFMLIVGGAFALRARAKSNGNGKHGDDDA